MGCPDIYYKKALQAFAYSLNFISNRNKAEELEKETNEEILEKEIMEWKNKLSVEQFYFQAGKACEFVMNYADENDGCDGLNACIGGLNSFESFIGIEDDEEE